MKVRTVQHTSGVVNKVTVKLAKRDLVKLFVLMTTVTAAASIPVGYLRRNLIDDAVQKLAEAAKREYGDESLNRSDEDA